MIRHVTLTIRWSLGFGNRIWDLGWDGMGMGWDGSLWDGIWAASIGCPIYHQHIHNNSWDRIYPISIISHSSSVSFIHYCKTKCSLQQYDITNREYIRNDFFFTAI